jgi:dTDP-4-amino-4,6-dideoxygalactose transaminase
MDPTLNRRQFIASSSAAGAAIWINPAAPADDKPALLGGTPVRREGFASWPAIDPGAEKALVDVLRSGRWYRGGGPKVSQFEASFAELMGAKHCVATANGTSALYTSLSALDVGPGDEVIVPPYTFQATVTAVLQQYALPVFVDTDPETFQIDARKIEAAFTDRTAAIIPVHIGGGVADLETVLSVAGKRKLPVIEDACQAHLAECRGRKVGTWGTTGCFSFQVSKHLCSGEGGAILTNDAEMASRCYAFHDCYRRRSGGAGFELSQIGGRGGNLRMTEFQGALLTAQMSLIEEKARIREQNAQYLTSMLKEIPGLQPAARYEGTTRIAYHMVMFRYKKEGFEGLSRSKFLQAMRAEGIPAGGGYSPLNKEAFFRAALSSRAYRRIYPKEILDGWEERNQCPVNDQLCQEAVWLHQNMLLGPRGDMDQIAAAVRKIQAHAGEIAKA